MGSSAIPEAVFLDTQVFEAASFNLSSTPFEALGKHLESGRLRLVVTDITVREVKARIAKGVAEEVQRHKKFRQSARVTRSSSLTEAKGALAALDAAAITTGIQEAFQDYFDQYDAEVVDTSELEAGPVFEKYFANAAPFAAGDKKHEFPDAFVIEGLAAWAEENEAGIFVVSADVPIREACDGRAGLHPKTNLAEVLDHVASDDEKLAEFIRDQVVSRAAEVGKAAQEQFEGLGFWVEDEWGDVEIEVGNVELSDDPEILDISGQVATVQMTFDGDIEAHLSYEDSDTGMYDSEEGRRVFMDQKEESVDCEEEFVVEVKIKFDGVDPGAFEIVAVDLVEPSTGYGFRTSKMEGYPWK